MSAYLDFAKDLAQAAGVIMRQYFQIGVLYDIKDDNSPVTKADTAINQLVIERVRARFPSHGVLGEEDSFNQTADNVWLVDPIDGTVPFLRGIPTNVFSLALVQDGVPRVGLIYDPYQDRMFYATIKGGAYLNGKRIATAAKTNLDSCYVTTVGRQFLKNTHFRQELYDQRARILTFHSIAYELAMVAAGQFDGTIFTADHPWDVAAAKVIIEEAGGVTSDLWGNDQPYNQPIKGFVASCTPAFHKELLAVLKPSLV